VVRTVREKGICTIQQASRFDIETWRWVNEAAAIDAINLRRDELWPLM
jgi:hypothetical protein